MGKKPKSGDENNEKAIDSVADTSGPSTQTKETMPQSSETAKEVRVFQSKLVEQISVASCRRHKRQNV